MYAQKIDQFRYIKIQFQTIDLRTRLWGIKPHKLRIYSPEPRTEVYCLRLNFNNYIEIGLLYLPRGRDSLCWSKEAQPLGTRMVNILHGKAICWHSLCMCNRKSVSISSLLNKNGRTSLSQVTMVLLSCNPSCIIDLTMELF